MGKIWKTIWWDRIIINRIVGEKRYQVNEQFKEECKANVGQYEKTGKIHVIEDNLDITHNDNLVDFKIEDNCYVNDKFIGTTVAKKNNCKYFKS